MRAEQEDVARHRLHGPVFVDRADEGVVGLGDDAVVADLGDRAARGERREPRARTRPRFTVDRVVEHVAAALTAPGLHAVRRELDHLVERLAGEIAVRRGAAHQLVELVGAPLACADLGHDLLGQDVERQHRRLDGVEDPGAHRAEQRGALQQLVARQGEEPALRHAGARVVRPADPLQEGGDAARRPDLAHQLHRTDVDAQLERRRGDERRQLARRVRLDAMAAVLREAAVVRGDDVFAEAFAELVRQPLGEPAGVDEHERGAVLAHVRRDAVEHVGHLLGARDRFQLAFGQLDREVEVALVAGVDDGGQRAVADEQAGDGFDGALRRRQPDADRTPLAQRFEALSVLLMLVAVVRATA